MFTPRYSVSPCPLYNLEGVAVDLQTKVLNEEKKLYIMCLSRIAKSQRLKAKVKTQSKQNLSQANTCRFDPAAIWLKTCF